MTRLNTILRCLLLGVFAFGCATTRYEEFGEAPKEAIIRDANMETMPLLEQRIRDLEDRVGRIEAELVTRFTGLETSQGDLATRVMVLAEQLEALSMQVQKQPEEKPVVQSAHPVMPDMSLERLYEQGLSAYYDRQYISAQEKFERIVNEPSQSPNITTGRHFEPHEFGEYMPPPSQCIRF